MKPECAHCRERFSEYLDGLLSPPERAEADAHLAGCAGCRQELDRWRATLQALGELPRHGAPEGFGSRVMAGLEAPLEAPRARVRSLWLRAMPVAAMLLVVFGVIVIVQRSGERGPAAERAHLALSQPAAPAASVAPAPAAAEAPAAPAPTAVAGSVAFAGAAASPAGNAAGGVAGYYNGRSGSGGAPARTLDAGRTMVADNVALAKGMPAESNEEAPQDLASRQRGMEAANGLRDSSLCSDANGGRHGGIQG